MNDKPAAWSPLRPSAADRPAYSSRELFGECKQIRIIHAGQIYLLQITRQGKLILTK